VMVLLLANVFTGPLKRLAVVAARIGEGRYEQNWAALHQNRLRDEIGTLTSVIEQMAAKVYQRERNLQQAVKELRIEIDEVKKAKQVTEIVDTDFFRDLKSRARSMRNRAERNQDGAEGQAEGQEPWPPET
jgi:methyl-accepting chemotaxis protein